MTRYAPTSQLRGQWVGNDFFADALSIPEAVWEEGCWDEEEAARWVAAEIADFVGACVILPEQVVLFYPAYELGETDE